MTELHQHIVVFLQGRQNLFQTVLGKERVGGQSTAGIVGDADGLVEPPRSHLSPTGPRLGVLIRDGRVAAKIYRYVCLVPLNLQLTDGRCRTVELQGQTVIPAQGLGITGLQSYLFLAVNIV